MTRSCARKGCNESIEHLPRQSKYCSRPCKDATHYAKHAEQRRTQQATYRAEHRLEASDRTARWRETNREQHRAVLRASCRRNPLPYQQARDARRGRLAIPYTAADWRAVLRHYRNACAYCGSTDRLEKDHVIPLARGGMDCIGNVVPACFSCNRSKHAKFLMEWRVQQLRRSRGALAA